MTVSNTDPGTSAMSAPRPRRQWLALGAALLVLGAALGWLEQMAASNAPAAPAAIVPEPLPVSVRQIAPASQRAQIRVLAQVQPRWQTAIKAFVRAEVIAIAPAVRAGSQVRRGDLLVTLQDSAYRAAVAEARNRLSRSEVRWLEAQREAQQARRNWQRAALAEAPGSPLTLHEPQLQAARAEVEAAQAALADAQTQLDYTRLRAPYDGVIVRTSVNPGEVVEAGQMLLELLDHRQLEIPVLLDASQWQLLASDWQGQPAQVQLLQGEARWQARLEREGAEIDRASRQRRLYLTLNLPAEPQGASATHPRLLPGETVRVTLPGRRFDAVLAVPQGAYTRDGYVWWVDASRQLQRYRAQPLFADQQHFYLPLPEGEGPAVGAWNLVLAPLSNFVPGTLVAVREPNQADTRLVTLATLTPGAPR